ncbi:hypothetical protein LZ30DRAFT_215858 [Colletotrichum cereale]|nr:hypothetical protein LZ30DRAFT_215858 [Colletotrichum cereale]
MGACSALEGVVYNGNPRRYSHPPFPTLRIRPSFETMLTNLCQWAKIVCYALICRIRPKTPTSFVFKDLFEAGPLAAWQSAKGIATAADSGWPGPSLLSLLRAARFRGHERGCPAFASLLLRQRPERRVAATERAFASLSLIEPDTKRNVANNGCGGEKTCPSTAAICRGIGLARYAACSPVQGPGGLDSVEIRESRRGGTQRFGSTRLASGNPVARLMLNGSLGSDRVWGSSYGLGIQGDRDVNGEKLRGM